jgi:hypothetical protein
MKFQLLHRAVKGTPVVSLNTVTRAVHIRLIARQIHNARILLTAAANCPAHLATLSPPQPCSSPAPPLPVWRRWWGHSYWRADVCPANLKTVDADPSTSSAATTTSRPATSGHKPQWIRPLRPSREQLLHSQQRLVLLEPPTPTLSLATKIDLLYIHVNVELIKETCLDSSSSIECGFHGWMLLLQVCFE